MVLEPPDHADVRDAAGAAAAEGHTDGGPLILAGGEVGIASRQRTVARSCLCGIA